jgi:hypothetical protein
MSEQTRVQRFRTALKWAGDRAARLSPFLYIAAVLVIGGLCRYYIWRQSFYQRGLMLCRPVPSVEALFFLRDGCVIAAAAGCALCSYGSRFRSAIRYLLIGGMVYSFAPLVEWVINASYRQRAVTKAVAAFEESTGGRSPRGTALGGNTVFRLVQVQSIQPPMTRWYLVYEESGFAREIPGDQIPLQLVLNDR